MRLHSLTVQAFGPFADRQVVDFDSLNEAGVFLLTGPTGAGKTSVLDAVCFALYGTVPGDREVRGLRSDHAEPGVAPQVVLDLTLAGRRLRVERWPEWRRPKKRGHGTTTEHAGARLIEIEAGGVERLLSSRVQEVGHELGPMLGMTCDQFKQVVLLPQGRFQTFLNASSDERRVVLERLFATERFTRIETWVQDRAAVLRRQADEGRDEVLRLVSTMGHRAGVPAPETADPSALGEWRDAVLAGATDAAEAAATRESDARKSDAEAQEQHRVVTEAHMVARRRDQAQRELGELEESAGEETDAVRRLDDHRRAATVTSVVAALPEAVAALAEAQRRSDEAVGGLDEPLDRHGCDAAAARLQQRRGELRRLEDVVEVLRDARSRADRLQAELTELEERRDAVDDEAATLPERREGVVSRLTEARRHADRLDERRAQLRQAEERRSAAEALPAAQQEVDDLRRTAAAAHERANAARHAHLDLVERRLRGMAGELAGQLEDGAPCQVCGSREHPAPAPAGPGGATDEQQRAAAGLAEVARSDHDEAQRSLALAQQRVALLEAATGGLDAVTAQVAVDQVSAELERCEQARSEVAALVQLLADVERRGDEVAEQRERLRSSRDSVAAALAGAREVVARTVPQVESVLGPDGSLGDALAAADEELQQVQAAADALAALADARRHHDDCRRRADEAVAAAGFAGHEGVRAAVLDPAEEDRLEQMVDRRRETRARALGVLAEPEVRALDDAVSPCQEADVVAARRHAAEAREVLHTAVADLRSAEERRAALVGLADQLGSALAAWLPLRDQHQLADSMSQLVRGVGGDNQLQMRLSSYVLATRLDQVLEAANERLGQMRDRRFTLHRAAAGRGGRGRTGLDLEVLDDWTGDTRPPSSLSGGETFKLSLALALGLADVITHEAGGLGIETLFIDEGFGMLDADTLDEVMDCIDELRSGGRAVGVVSHVSELRARIATQLQVTSSPRGSCLGVATTPA